MHHIVCKNYQVWYWLKATRIPGDKLQKCISSYLGICQEDTVLRTEVKANLVTVRVISGELGWGESVFRVLWLHTRRSVLTWDNLGIEASVSAGSVEASTLQQCNGRWSESAGHGGGGVLLEDSMLLQTSKVPVALEPPAFQGLTTKASIVPFQGLTARLCYHWYRDLATLASLSHKVSNHGFCAQREILICQRTHLPIILIADSYSKLSPKISI